MVRDKPIDEGGNDNGYQANLDKRPPVSLPAPGVSVHLCTLLQSAASAVLLPDSPRLTILGLVGLLRRLRISLTATRPPGGLPVALADVRVSTIPLMLV